MELFWLEHKKLWLKKIVTEGGRKSMQGERLNVDSSVTRK